VCSLIRDNGIRIYRQDHNFAPLEFWRTNEADDRRGMRENLHVQGYLRYWDDLLARKDVEYCKGINLQQAFDDGRITAEKLHDLVQRAGKELAAAGFEDLNPEPTHWLLSITPQGELIRDEHGEQVLRLCNFGLVRQLRLEPDADRREGAVWHAWVYGAGGISG
jgi:hypothetical protein